MKAIPNPLLETFRTEGHAWAGPLVEVLEDFEIRLQLLESEPGGLAGKTSGKVTPVFVKRSGTKRAQKKLR